MTFEFSKPTMWNDYFKSCSEFVRYIRDRVNAKNVTKIFHAKSKQETLLKMLMILENWSVN